MRMVSMDEQGRKNPFQETFERLRVDFLRELTEALGGLLRGLEAR